MWRRVARTGGERWIESAPTDERRKAPKSSCNRFRFRFRFGFGLIEEKGFQELLQ